MCSPLTLLSVKLPTYPQMYRLEGSYFYIVIKLLMFVYRSPNRRPPEEVERREYLAQTKRQLMWQHDDCHDSCSRRDILLFRDFLSFVSR